MVHGRSHRQGCLHTSVATNDCEQVPDDPLLALWGQLVALLPHPPDSCGRYVHGRLHHELARLDHGLGLLLLKHGRCNLRGIGQVREVALDDLDARVVHDCLQLLPQLVAHDMVLHTAAASAEAWAAAALVGKLGAHPPQHHGRLLVQVFGGIFHVNLRLLRRVDAVHHIATYENWAAPGIGALEVLDVQGLPRSGDFSELDTTRVDDLQAWLHNAATVLTPSHDGSLLVLLDRAYACQPARKPNDRKCSAQRMRTAKIRLGVFVHLRLCVHILVRARHRVNSERGS
mmetsp:Transcript_246/g.710  ORF Transcript_246/g.710 Transcript_246/m.710 type:complete len:287 (+) Transcript_246:207-1067(+)